MRNDIEHKRAEIVRQLRIMSDGDIPVHDLLPLVDETDKEHLAVAVGVLGAINFVIREPTVRNVLQYLIRLIERPT